MALVFGRYEILSLLGKGGMGAVYRALDVNLGREVALKTIDAAVLDMSAQLQERFRREARSVAKLSHPEYCDCL